MVPRGVVAVDVSKAINIGGSLFVPVPAAAIDHIDEALIPRLVTHGPRPVDCKKSNQFRLN